MSTVVLVAVAVAMDAFAVSVSSGIAITRMRLRHALVIASFFGFFQGLMPLLGWWAGHGVKGAIAGWDHWVGFFLLMAVGAHMIRDGFRSGENRETYNPLNIYVLFALSIATSIDALAVGLTLSFVGLGILLPVFVIAGVTFITSYAGVYIGAACGHVLESKVEAAGGLLLAGLGVKLLLEHLLA
ncbi:MAG: manganese efflux pump MntP family protein [Kiritimatiellia bacterium]